MLSFAFLTPQKFAGTTLIPLICFQIPGEEPQTEILFEISCGIYYTEKVRIMKGKVVFEI